MGCERRQSIIFFSNTHPYHYCSSNILSRLLIFYESNPTFLWIFLQLWAFNIREVINISVFNFRTICPRILKPHFSCSWVKNNLPKGDWGTLLHLWRFHRDMHFVSCNLKLIHYHFVSYVITFSLIFPARTKISLLELLLWSGKFYPFYPKCQTRWLHL